MVAAWGVRLRPRSISLTLRALIPARSASSSWLSAARSRCLRKSVPTLVASIMPLCQVLCIHCATLDRRLRFCGCSVGVLHGGERAVASDWTVVEAAAPLFFPIGGILDGPEPFDDGNATDILAAQIAALQREVAQLRIAQSGKRSASRPRWLVLLVTAAIALIASTAVYASIPDSTGVIHGCYAKHRNSPCCA